MLWQQRNLKLDLNVSDGDSYTVKERENFLKINENLKVAKEAVEELVIDTTMLSNAAIEGNFFFSDLERF